jgi:hypothetical protein
MAKTSIPAVPTGTAAAGRRLWREVLTRFDLDEHETAVLRECVRTVDQLDALDATIRRDGVVVLNARGRQVAHPALVEARQHRTVLMRLIASLRLPEDAAGSGRSQRRGAARGTYGVRGVAS